MAEHRIFVGIGLTPPLTSCCQQLQTDLKLRLARPIGAADLHVTLVPPFRTDEPDFIAALIAGVADRRPAITLRFGPVQVRDRRLIWLRCEDNPSLLNLRNELCDVIGQTPEPQFVPHITLARISPTSVFERLTNQPDLPLMPVTEVTLFQSPNHGGYGYRRLAVKRLQAPCAGID